MQRWHGRSGTGRSPPTRSRRITGNPTTHRRRRGRQGGRRRVSELATRSYAFCTRWAAHDVRLHHTGTKRFRRPSSATSPSPSTRWNSPPTPACLTLTIYTGQPGSPTEEKSSLLAS